MFNGYFDKLPEGISMGYLYIYEIWLYMSPEGKYGSNPIFFHIYIATVDGISIL